MHSHFTPSKGRMTSLTYSASISGNISRETGLAVSHDLLQRIHALGPHQSASAYVGEGTVSLSGSRSDYSYPDTVSYDDVKAIFAGSVRALRAINGVSVTASFSGEVI